MSRCENCSIKHSNSLRSMSKEELFRISDKKTLLRFKKGEELFAEGANMNGVFCLRNGKCKVTKLSQNGKDQIIRFVKKGDLIGERSVISDTKAHLTATALEDLEACFIPKKEIKTNFINNPNFSLDITQSICDNLDNANVSITNFAQKNVKERLADTLLLFDRTFGNDSEGFLNIKLSREEIANAIGTATESSIRLLSQFKRDGYIELTGKKIKLLNKIKLENISDGH